MTNTAHIMLTKTIAEFVAYVDSFYNPTHGIYPIKHATLEIIADAITKYVATMDEKQLNDFITLGADSVDRERVRDIFDPIA